MIMVKRSLLLLFILTAVFAVLIGAAVPVHAQSGYCLECVGNTCQHASFNGVCICVNYGSTCQLFGNCTCNLGNGGVYCHCTSFPSKVAAELREVLEKHPGSRIIVGCDDGKKAIRALLPTLGKEGVKLQVRFMPENKVVSINQGE